MKKFLSLFVSVICSLCIYAGEYDYITFITADGSQQIAAANLEMTVSNGNLLADNGATQLSLPLAKLQKMYFSDASGEFTGIDLTEFNSDAAVTVFSPEGKQIGSFYDMATAARSLDKGTYIVRQNNNSIKILVP